MAAQNYVLLTGLKMAEVSTKMNILGFSQTQMETFFKTMDEPKFRAIQVMKWIHQFGADDFESMTNVSKKLREKLALSAEIVEPEVKDLIVFLKKLGCKISWKGNRAIDIIGVKKLKPTKHKVIFDRIEAGTYIIASALTNGNLKIKNILPNVIMTEINLLKKMGVNIIKKSNYIIVSSSKKLNSINIKTEPYPGFPTDLQAQIMVLMTKASGISTIKENIFENRFMHVSELKRMGAHIEVNGKSAKIFGNKKLNGAELMATDLRASVSLVLAGLIAKNKTVLNRIYHLDRGYEKIEAKLSNCGAQIRRLQ